MRGKSKHKGHLCPPLAAHHLLPVIHSGEDEQRPEGPAVGVFGSSSLQTSV